MDIQSMLKIWKRNSKNIAKRNTNYDKGNVVNNAIKDYNISKGFVIKWDESNAHYIKFIDGGTRSIKASEFVRRTAEDIKGMIESGRNALQFVDRANNKVLQAREKRLRKSQQIWKKRTYNIADRDTRFRRGG